MSNRSYLYSLDFNPATGKRKKGDMVRALGESSDVPLSFMLLMSCNAQLIKSQIWKYKHPIAIIAEFEKGRMDLFDFLEKVAKTNVYDAKKLNEKIEKTKTFLTRADKNAKYILLEAGEVFQLNDKLPLETHAENLVKRLKQVSKIKKDFLEGLSQWKAAEQTRKLTKQKWIELGIDGWTDTLYYEINV